MDGDTRALRMLGWLGFAIGLTAALVSGCWVWLSGSSGRWASLPADLRLIAAGLGLLLLVMGLRCGRAARARDRRARG